MDNAFIAQFLKWDCRHPTPGMHRINTVLRKLRTGVQLAPPSFSWAMANVEARMNVFHLVSQTAAYGVPGDVVEIGCNSGESSIVIQRVLNQYAPEKVFHAFDSFEGLPELNGQDAKDAVYQRGSMSAKRQKFDDNFRAVGMQPPMHVHKGWFEETIPSKLPERISFALIDGDIYSSTKHVLPHVYGRLSKGAICMFGIYYDPSVFPRETTPGTYTSPGVKRACDEFFADKPEKVSVLYANEYSNGYFRKA